MRHGPDKFALLGICAGEHVGQVVYRAARYGRLRQSAQPVGRRFALERVTHQRNQCAPVGESVFITKESGIIGKFGGTTTPHALGELPVVSNGDHYDGREIPDHDTRPEFEEPAIWWTPAISPGELIVYRGERFAGWRGDALAAGLSSQAIVRMQIDGDSALEVERYPMGARIRSVAEGPDGALWVLEDERNESAGRLLKLTPRE